MVCGSMATTAGQTTSGMATIGGLFSQISHFSPIYFGEFFCICPLHPPSIFPISSSFIERLMYFLLSKDFVSQRIIRSTFNVSNFLIEKLIQGNFSVLLRKLAIDIPSIISTKSESIFIPRLCL